MSTQIDERVVEMTFDNAQFEEGIKTTMSSLKTFENTLQKMPGTSAGLSKIQSAIKSFSFGGLTSGVEQVTAKFNVMDMVWANVMSNMVLRAIDTGKRTVKALSIDQLSAGWTKYEDKTTSVQTIISATGKSMEEVSSQLQRLNNFTDETSYNFVDMVGNIGKFTSNNIALDDSVTAMQGIATWAAISGANAGEASRAMYNLSQALSTGAVTLMDWKSIENANMATTQFKQNVLDIAVAEKQLTKVNDKLYKTADGTEVTIEKFNSTLSEKWFTKDVLMKALDRYGGFSNKLFQMYEELGKEAPDMISTVLDDIDRVVAGEKAGDVAKGLPKYTKMLQELSKEEYSLGRKAFRAAQEAKTFTEALDATKDAVSTGWMNTFEKIFGNYEEAKDLWSTVAEEMYEIFAAGGAKRNDMLDEWRELDDGIDGREELLKRLGKAYDIVKKAVGGFKEELGGLFNEHDGKWFLGITNRIGDSAISAATFLANALKVLQPTIISVIRIVSKAVGYIFKGIKLIGGILITVVNAALKAVAPLATLIFRVFKQIATAVRQVITAPPIEAIKNAALGFIEWAKSLKLSESRAKDLRRIFRGLFAILELARMLISKIVKITKPFFSVAVNILGRVVGHAVHLLGIVMQLIREFEKFVKGDKLSNKFLESIFGDKATKSINDLKDAFSKFKLPKFEFDVGGFVDGIVEAFKNLGGRIKGFFDFGDEGFSFGGLFGNISKGIGQFVEDIKNTAFENTNLGEVLDSVRDKLDLLGGSFSDNSTFVGSFWQGLKKTLDYLGKAKTLIHNFATRVYDTFRKYLDFGGFFKDLWSNLKDLRAELKRIKDEGRPLRDSMVDIGKAFGEFFKSISTAASGRFDLSGLAKAIQNGVSYVWETFKTIITGKENATIIDLFSTVFETIRSSVGAFFGTIFDDVNEQEVDETKVSLFSSLVQKIVEPFKTLMGFNTSDSKKVSENTSGFVKSFVDGINAGLAGVDTQFLKNAVVFGILVYTILNVMKTLKTLSSASNSIDKLLKSFSVLTGNLNDLLFQGTKLLKANTFFVYAKGVVVIAAAMFLLASVDTDKLLNVATALALVIGAIGLVVFAFAALDLAKSQNDTVAVANRFTDSIKSFAEHVTDLFDSFKNVVARVGMILGIVGAIAGIALLIIKIVDFAEKTDNTKDKVWNAIAMLGVISGFLVVVVGVLSYISRNIPSKNKVTDSIGIASSLVGLAGALWLIVDAMKDMDTIDTEALKEAALPLGGIILALGAAAWAIGHSENDVKRGLGSILSVVGLAEGLRRIINVVKDLTAFNLYQLKEAVWPIVGIISALGLAAKAMGNVEHAYGAATTIISVGAALWLMAKGLEAISNVLKVSTVAEQAEGILLGFVGILAVAVALVAVIGYLTAGFSGMDATFIAVGTFLGGLGLAFLGLGAGIYLAADSLPAFADGLGYLAQKINEYAPEIILAIGTIVTGIAMAWVSGKARATLAAVGMVMTVLTAVGTALSGMSPEARDSLIEWVAEVLGTAWDGISDLVVEFGKAIVNEIAYYLDPRNLLDYNAMLTAYNQAQGYKKSAEHNREKYDKTGNEMYRTWADSAERSYDEALKEMGELSDKLDGKREEWLREHAPDNIFNAMWHEGGKEVREDAKTTAEARHLMYQKLQEEERNGSDPYRRTVEEMAELERQCYEEAAAKRAAAAKSGSDVVSEAIDQAINQNSGDITSYAATTKSELSGVASDLQEGDYLSAKSLFDLFTENVMGFADSGDAAGVQEAFKSFIGTNLDAGTAQGIVDGSVSIKDALTDLGGNIPGWAATVLGIQSPSTVMRDDVGIYIPWGVADGIDLGSDLFITPAMQRMGNTIATAFTGTDISGAVSTAATSAVTAAGDAFYTADTAKFGTAGVNAYTAYVGGISKQSGQMKKELSTAMLAAVKGATAYVARFRTLGEQAGVGFINGMRSKLTAAAQAGAAIANAAKNALKAAQDSNSPSRVFAGLGVDASQGYVNGIISLRQSVADAAEDMGNAAIYATASQMSKISSILESGGDFQPVIAPVVDLSNVYAGANSIHSLMGQTYELATVNARMSAERDTSSLNDIASILNGLDFNSDNTDVVAAVNSLSTDIANLGLAIQSMKVQLGGKTVGVINSGLGQKQTMQNRGVSNG